MNPREPRPDRDNVLPFQIGIAPARPEPRRILNSGGKPAALILGMDGKLALETPELVDVTGETLNLLTWDQFLAWRKTKCRPFANEGTRFALNPELLTGNESDESAKRRAIEEIDQAILEFIGEVAEVGELFIANPTSAGRN